MPAIITHDQFGREALEKAASTVVSTKQEKEAFLLGNRRPRPAVLLRGKSHYRQISRAWQQNAP